MRKTKICLLVVVLMLVTALRLSAGDKVYTEQSEVWVNNEEEFVGAIAPNTAIKLNSQWTGILTFPGEYLGEISDFVNFTEGFDGAQIVIHDVHNLSITGDPDILSQILAQPRYAYTLMFKNCEGITLANLNCGHTDEGYCTGGVLGFENCHGIKIDNCDLWGCGTEGITLWESSRLDCTNTTIRDCSYSILSLYDSGFVSFSNCVMRNNREFDLLNFVNCAKVEFKNCVIYDNSATSYWSTGSLINSRQSEVSFSECAIFNNSVTGLTDTTDQIVFEHCAIFGNKERVAVPDEEIDSEGEGEWNYEDER